MREEFEQQLLLNNNYMQIYFVAHMKTNRPAGTERVGLDP
jgi:hypothetical protein